jgi:hydrogenase/urease accessory protein HupE
MALLLTLFAAMLALPAASAHEEPTSFLDLHLESDGVRAILTASATDLAHDLPRIEPDMLLSPAGATAQGDALMEILRTRLLIAVDGAPLDPLLRAITPVPEKRDVRLEFHFAWSASRGPISVQCRLFPYDPRHRTFLGIYENGRLERQEIFQGDAEQIEFKAGSTQGTGAVVRQFVAAGIHHIFIGADHILFVVGLLLLGGRVRLLLKIVTAFTVAHSVTLGLATFGILTPPASLIEPAIALSIVCVGVHAFLGARLQDPRLLFAFCFGLIHGFGFANVLQEMVLPRAALGWSLFAFNGGVEIGQACIVAAVAPLLALLHRRNRLLEARVVSFGALAVTTAGAFWFFQRVMP